jgi:hypothetical protein
MSRGPVSGAGDFQQLNMPPEKLNSQTSRAASLAAARRIA